MLAGGPMEIVVGALVLASLVSVVGGWLIWQNYVVCDPNELVVLTGRTGPDGRGYRLLRGGRTLRFPFLEQVDRMALGPFPAEVRVDDAFVHEGVPVQVTLTARFQVRAMGPSAHIAVERYLGKDTQVIVSAGTEVIGGVVRVSTAKQSLVAIEDREAFGRGIERSAEAQLEAVGLQATVRVESVDLV